MKLLLTLATDQGQFITQVEVQLPERDLDLSAPELSFRHLLFNKALEKLQAEGQLECAVRRYGGVVCLSSSLSV